MKRICVYCGSSPGFDPGYMAMAQQLGQALVDRQYELVYGGAAVGLMGQVADTVMRAGGVVIGVIPKALAHKVSHQGLTQLHVVASMHARKTMMFDLADACIALPGGFGTLEEVAEFLTWAQLRLHTKPCGLLNVAGYFDLLLAFLDNAVAQGFMKQAHREMLLVATTPQEMLTRLEGYTAPVVEKWVEPQK
ncbi:MAG: TIGR00730 family Rossman fold protein [bacterium]|nr:TIGR00730 family Rossman fold protein [bacterium]